MYVFSNYIRVFLTTIVLGIFLFFWMNGPLLGNDNFIAPKLLHTEYSLPKLVEEEGDKKVKGFGTIKSVETNKDFGNAILSNKEKVSKSTGLINTGSKVNKNSSVYKKQFEEHLERLNLPEADIIQIKGIPLALFKNDKSVYIETGVYNHNIRGYAGKIDLGIHVNKYGEILDVYHLESHETESYLKKIINKGYFNQYKNISINKPHTLDAVTGATITSKAIAQTITVVVSEAKLNTVVNYVDVNDDEAFSIVAELDKWWILHICIIGFFFVYNFQKKFKKTKKTVIIVNILSVLYIGFFLNNSFTYVTFIHPFVGTNISMFVGIYALLTLLGSIWGKNLYCKFICPYGNAQKLLLKLSPKKIQTKFFISNKWVSRIRDIVTIVLIVGVLMGLRNWNNYELFPDLFGMEFYSSWFFVSLGIVLINLRYPLIWCRMLCPTGAVLDSIDKISNNKFKW